MSKLNDKLIGIMKNRKDKTQRRGSLLNPNNERKFDSGTLLESLKEIEEEKKDDKGSSSTNSDLMNTGTGRKKTRKKKGKKRKTRKRRKNRAHI